MGMKRRNFIATWFANASVALLIVGGFQADTASDVRIISLALAVMFLAIAMLAFKEE